ncbi:MAG TPA: hypothetical protein VF666_09455 [Pyrinomonadaceae bacterium]|jgi:hypothetical protein
MSTPTNIDPPIIITGGSVTIDFDENGFQREGKKFTNQNKKIKSIEVARDGVDPVNLTVKDGRCTITIRYE